MDIFECLIIHLKYFTKLPKDFNSNVFDNVVFFSNGRFALFGRLYFIPNIFFLHYLVLVQTQENIITPVRLSGLHVHPSGPSRVPPRLHRWFIHSSPSLAYPFAPTKMHLHPSLIFSRSIFPSHPKRRSQCEASKVAGAPTFHRSERRR